MLCSVVDQQTNEFTKNNKQLCWRIQTNRSEQPVCIHREKSLIVVIIHYIIVKMIHPHTPACMERQEKGTHTYASSSNSVCVTFPLEKFLALIFIFILTKAAFFSTDFTPQGNIFLESHPSLDFFQPSNSSFSTWGLSFSKRLKQER